MKSLHYMAISVFFGKDDLDILPPPPPFPDETKKGIARMQIQQEPKRQKPLNKEKSGERGKEKILWKKILERKKKDEEIVNQRIKEIKKKFFDFLHELGLIKTEEEKKELQRQREEYKNVRKKIKKNAMEEAKKIRQDKGKIKTSKPITAKEAITPKIKLFFKKLFSGKEHTTNKGITKPEEVIKAEKEIQKAIEDMKNVKVKKASFMHRLFRKEKKKEEQELKSVEMPHVMPRIEDKKDKVMLIEANIYKARTALMEFKLEDSKKIYMSVIKIYNELEPKKKSKVYQDIKDLYYERKSAEKFAG
ncbi:hypothetical protein HYX01_04470 [Candidatus Woesearchaeota archaeon]|nr:hypothetical protein [Candidatus Woesearchaeota archaeon]